MYLPQRAAEQILNGESCTGANAVTATTNACHVKSFEEIISSGAGHSAVAAGKRRRSTRAACIQHAAESCSFNDTQGVINRVGNPRDNACGALAVPQGTLWPSISAQPLPDNDRDAEERTGTSRPLSEETGTAEKALGGKRRIRPTRRYEEYMLQASLVAGESRRQKQNSKAAVSKCNIRLSVTSKQEPDTRMTVSAWLGVPSGGKRTAKTPPRLACTETPPQGPMVHADRGDPPQAPSKRQSSGTPNGGIDETSGGVVALKSALRTQRRAAAAAAAAKRATAAAATGMTVSAASAVSFAVTAPFVGEEAPSRDSEKEAFLDVCFEAFFGQAVEFLNSEAEAVAQSPITHDCISLLPSKQSAIRGETLDISRQPTMAAELALGRQTLQQPTKHQLLADIPLLPLFTATLQQLTTEADADGALAAPKSTGSMGEPKNDTGKCFARAAEAPAQRPAVKAAFPQVAVHRQQQQQAQQHGQQQEHQQQELNQHAAQRRTTVAPPSSGDEEGPSSQGTRVAGRALRMQQLAEVHFLQVDCERQYKVSVVKELQAVAALCSCAASRSICMQPDCMETNPSCNICLSPVKRLQVQQDMLGERFQQLTLLEHLHMLVRVRSILSTGLETGSGEEATETAARKKTHKTRKDTFPAPADVFNESAVNARGYMLVEDRQNLQADASTGDTERDSSAAGTS